MNRKDGYVADVSYPPHFFKEMQPVWLSAVANFAGAQAPDITRPYSYCELGCGMGINLLVAAASNPNGHFIGVDFNEKHIAIARDAAQFIGLKNLSFIHSDFSHFAQNNALFFDFIASHGAWSWIAAEHQQSILRIVAKSLKPKGIFYLHYMCHPGATRMIPLQKLLNDLAHHLPGTSAQNIQTGIALLQRLAGAGAFIEQPGLSIHLEALAGKNANFLAHEFLTDFWQPQHSTDVHQRAAQAGVRYIGSANTFENMDELSVPGAIKPLLAGLPSLGLKETVKDLARNQHQRTDLFQRDPVSSTPQEYFARLGSIIFKLLPNAPTSGALTFATPIGEIPGPAEIFSPLLEKLAERPASFDELKHLPVFSAQTGLLSQALQMLMWNEVIHPVRKDLHLSDNQQLTKLNEWISKNKLSIKVIGECGTAIRYGADV